MIGLPYGEKTVTIC